MAAVPVACPARMFDLLTVAVFQPDRNRKIFGSVVGFDLDLAFVTVSLIALCCTERPHDSDQVLRLVDRHQSQPFIALPWPAHCLDYSVHQPSGHFSGFLLLLDIGLLYIERLLAS